MFSFASVNCTSGRASLANPHRCSRGLCIHITWGSFPGPRRRTIWPHTGSHRLSANTAQILVKCCVFIAEYDRRLGIATNALLGRRFKRTAPTGETFRFKKWTTCARRRGTGHFTHESFRPLLRSFRPRIQATSPTYTGHIAHVYKKLHLSLHIKTRNFRTTCTYIEHLRNASFCVADGSRVERMGNEMWRMLPRAGWYSRTRGQSF